ncbi:calcium-transporting ATPase 2, plasma membrane-type-like protein [Tanacetum coccineum]
MVYANGEDNEERNDEANGFSFPELLAPNRHFKINVSDFPNLDVKHGVHSSFYDLHMTNTNTDVVYQELQKCFEGFPSGISVSCLPHLETVYIMEFNRSLDYKALGVSTIEDIVVMMGKEYVLWFEGGESRGKYAMSTRMVEMRRKLYLKREVQELLIRKSAEGSSFGFEGCISFFASWFHCRIHEPKMLEYHGGVVKDSRGVKSHCIRGDGIAKKLKTSTSDGISTEGLRRRQELFGINKFAETAQKSFWVFVWEALHDMTLMVLGSCAFVSLIVGIATEGWPKGARDGLGIAASILLVVFITATSDYRQSLQFKDLDKEKKKISISIPQGRVLFQGYALSNTTVFITQLSRASLESYSIQKQQGVFGCVIQTHITSKTESG